MVLRSKKTVHIGKFAGEPVDLSHLSPDELEYIEICVLNSERSDHPEAKYGAHPDVLHYYRDLVARNPEKAIELLIATGRASTQLAQELGRVQGVFARDWYEMQAPDVQSRVDAKLATLSAMPPDLAIFEAVNVVKDEIKSAQKLKNPPPGMSATN